MQTFSSILQPKAEANEWFVPLCAYVKSRFVIDSIPYINRYFLHKALFGPLSLLHCCFLDRLE